MENLVDSGVELLLLLVGQAGLLVVNSGIPVLAGNVIKNFIPKMDGKTDKVVNVFTVLLFIYGYFSLEVFNQDILFDFLPGMIYKAKDVIQLANAVILALVAVGLNEPIYVFLKGKIGRFFGKSFSVK